MHWLQHHGVSDSQLNTAGLRIVSSLDAQLQTSGQRAVWHAGLKPGADYVLVMPSVDPATGAVTTMITSRRYGLHGRGYSVEPLFTAAYAGAGSTYKYFTAAAALTAGAPTSLSLTTGGNHYRTQNCRSGSYSVHNAGNYPDTMPLSDALPQSSNTYFVALEDQFFGCRLQGVVQTALHLGMNRLRQPLTSAAAGSIAHEVVQSQEPTFTLGQEPTAALELTGAFSAAANDGVFCPPTPVLRLMRSNATPLPLKGPPCRQAFTPYVARTIVSLMRRDTHDGTAASYFQRWYARHGSDVAGKTGTDNNAADNGNSALWFVGLTPHLVAAASLVNPDNPKQTVHDLPGMPGAWVGQDIFGAYASTYWLDAYAPALRRQWSWPSPSDLPRTRNVPPVIGEQRSTAEADLRRAGLGDERIAPALKQLHANIGHGWSVGQLASIAALSRSAFFERFTRLVGSAPMEYLLILRMHIAKALLRANELSVAVIAERVGYGSTSAFSAAFSRHVGVAPSQYCKRTDP